MNLLCPICAEQLKSIDRQYRCIHNHSFDIARQGYVHLLPVQNKRSLAPGDTREQVLSRRAFLEEGHYAPIAAALIDAAREFGAEGALLDVGCGEGYYCTRLSCALGLPLTGLDISKEAVRCAAAKYKGPNWLCATAAHIPVEEESVALLTSLFALTLPEEFARVLRTGGHLLLVGAGEHHLMGLKRAIYDQTYQNAGRADLPQSMEQVDRKRLTYTVTVKGQEQIEALFSMTPYYWRTSIKDKEKLRGLDELQTEVDFDIFLFRKGL